MSNEVLIDVRCPQCREWNEGLRDPGWRKKNCAVCGRELHVSDETRRHGLDRVQDAEKPSARPSTARNMSAQQSDAEEDRSDIAPATKQRKYQVNLKAPNGAIMRIDPAMVLSRPTEMSSNSLTFVIEESTVSRKHLWIGCACNELIFVDLGSINGTTVNGSSLSPFVPHARPYRPERIQVQLGKSYQLHVEVEPLP